MNEAIALCVQCGTAGHLHRNLGLMCCHAGNLKDGEKELRAALELNPNDAEAKKAIDLLQNLHTANHKDATTSDD
jgi:Flp pilus assembly protein TadD